MQQELTHEPIAPDEVTNTSFRDALVAATPRAFVTPAIITLNVLVFLAMLVRGVPFLQPSAQQVLPWGADFGPLVASGQWWRIIAACFLHFGIVHIAVNMYVLWQVGSFTERLFGNLRFALLYMIAGVGGNIAGLYFHPFAVGAGASGAIFGVFGALLAYLLVQRGVVPRAAATGITRSALLFVAYNLIAGFARPETDQVAHVGGIFTGFLAGCVLARPLARGRAHHRPALAAGVALGAAVLSYAAMRSLPRLSPEKSEWYTQLVTGTDLNIGHNDRVVYTGAATPAQAEHLARDLKATGILQPADVAVLFSRDPKGAILSIPLRADAGGAKPAKVTDGQSGKSAQPSALHVMPWDDPKTLAFFRTIGPQLANSAGGPPLTIRLVNNTGELKAQVRVNDGELFVGTHDRVVYTAPYTPAQAQALGAALQAAQIFRDTGAVAALARTPAGVSLVLLPTRSGWPETVNAQSVDALAKSLVAITGSPLTVRLADPFGQTAFSSQAQ